MAPCRRSSDSNAASSRSLTKRLSSSPSVTATRSDKRATRRKPLKKALDGLLGMSPLRQRHAATSHCFEQGHLIRKLPKKASGDRCQGGALGGYVQGLVSDGMLNGAKDRRFFWPPATAYPAAFSFDARRLQGIL